MLRDFQAFQLAKKLHWSCRTLSVQYYLRDQLLRASASIALNIAEGSGKRTPNEQRRYYGIALGSLRECEAVLELEWIERPEARDQINRLGAILYTLARAKETEPKQKPKPQRSTQTD